MSHAWFAIFMFFSGVHVTLAAIADDIGWFALSLGMAGMSFALAGNELREMSQS